MRLLYQFITFSIIKILRGLGGVPKSTEAVYWGARSLIVKSLMLWLDSAGRLIYRQTAQWGL